jgi:uncharacterized protein YbjT (DUF2867 family)
MTIVINTPTGNIGGKLTQLLLDQGVDVTLLARDPAKVAHFTARGAKLKVGSLDDAAFVKQATEGASALFWVTPPNFAAPSLRAWQDALGKNLVAAVEANRIPRVVHLSSVGAQLPSGAGPISGLRPIEDGLNAVASSVVHLRAGFFMENFFHDLGAIKGTGAFYSPNSGNTPIPMVATQDIAAAAAEELLRAPWSGVRVRGVQGPADLSLKQAAAALSEGLGVPVAFVSVTPEQALGAMQGVGMSHDLASLYVEMAVTMDTVPNFNAEPRSAETTTPTSLAEFARTTLKPALG